MRQPDLLKTLLSLLNFALIGFVAAFTFLLFGDSILDSIRNAPQAKERANRPVSKPRSTLSPTVDYEEVKDGIHTQTGLVFAEGFDIVRGTCTPCHSAKLITQNRATRAGWEEMIRWMQAKQGLGDLGANEPIILDYLAQHYAPKDIGRRAKIDVEAIEWYLLDLPENPRN